MLRTYRPALIGCALLVVGGFVALGSENAAHMMALTAVWVLMATGWNIISGYAGPISLGQGAFFGLTAFITTVLFATFNITPYLGILIGIVASIVLAAVIGLTTLRLSGLYFALATLTIPLIMGTITRYFGFHEVPRPYVGESLAYFQFDSTLPYYLAAAVLVAISLFVTTRMERTRMGRYFVAIRENERAAEASGVPTFRYKFIAFAIGAGFSALAGGLYSQLSFVFAPEEVYSPLISVQALLIVLIGGSGTVLGPMLGALIVIPISEITAMYFSDQAGVNDLAYAVVLLIVAFWSKRGLYPYFAEVLARLWSSIRPGRGSPPPGPRAGSVREPLAVGSESAERRPS